MKHIKRRFLKQQKVKGDLPKRMAISTSYTDQAQAGFLSIAEGSHYPVLITEENDLIQGFFYQAAGKTYMIPEPNLISVYFDISQSQIQFLYPAKVDLLMNIDRNGDVGKTLNATHTFFHHSCICILFLYNAVEGIINQQLPPGKDYVKKDDKSTVTYSCEQIQKGISFEEKIKSVLPQFLNRSFHQDHGHKYETIKKLKELRDEIAHTKAYAGNDSPNFYKRIFTQLLDFDYDKALQHSMDFINYFQADLIEECPCGRPD